MYLMVIIIFWGNFWSILTNHNHNRLKTSPTNMYHQNERKANCSRSVPTPNTKAEKTRLVWMETSSFSSYLLHFRWVLLYVKWIVYSSKHLIKTALKNNDFLKNLDKSQVHEIVNCMYQECFKEGDYIIRENDAGDHFFVSAGESNNHKKNKFTFHGKGLIHTLPVSLLLFNMRCSAILSYTPWKG